jgi:hypothetical protein
MLAVVEVSRETFIGALGESWELIRVRPMEMGLLVGTTKILVEMLEATWILVAIVVAEETIKMWVLVMVIQEITRIRTMVGEVEAGQVF